MDYKTDLMVPLLRYWTIVLNGREQSNLTFGWWISIELTIICILILINNSFYVPCLCAKGTQNQTGIKKVLRAGDCVVDSD